MSTTTATIVNVARTSHQRQQLNANTASTTTTINTHTKNTKKYTKKKTITQMNMLTEIANNRHGKIAFVIGSWS